MRYFKKLIGKRIYLAPINIEDAEKYTQWLNDLEVSINLTLVPQVLSLEKEKEVLERLSKEEYIFSIVTLDKEELIGNCSLMNVNLIHRTAELGILIGDKNYWGKGYGSEAINLLLDFAFNILNLNNILLKVFSFNKRALKCYQKCGFKEIGRQREAIIFGSRKYDIIYMDILASEFKGEITNLLAEE